MVASTSMFTCIHICEQESLFVSPGPQGAPELLEAPASSWELRCLENVKLLHNPLCGAAWAPRKNAAIAQSEDALPLRLQQMCNY